MTVNVSFICKNCGVHVRKGNHAACKIILKAKREEEEIELSRKRGFATVEAWKMSKGKASLRGLKPREDSCKFEEM